MIVRVVGVISTVCFVPHLLVNLQKKPVRSTTFAPPLPILSLYFHFHTTSKSQMRTSYFSVLPFLFRCKYTFSQPCKTVVVSRQKTTASNVKLQRRSPRRRRRWSRRRPPQLPRRRRRSSSSGGGGRSTEVSADSSPPLTHLAQLSLPHA